MHWLGPYEGFAGGGALFFYGSTFVTISTCNVGDSSIMKTGWGGALFFSTSNTITISNCTFINNNINTFPGDGQGGALYFQSSYTITIIDSTIEKNSVTTKNGLGGALFFSTSNTITISRCKVIDNGVNGHNGQGGALYFTSSNQISIAQCSFISNTADSGGAIYIGHQSAFIGMTAVHFSRNVALTGAGGAVYVSASCSYISLGGPMPMLETCMGVCDQASNVVSGYGHKHTILRGSASLHVVGYYVVFNDIPFNVVSVGYCGDTAIVGDYIYGYGPGDGNCTCVNCYTAPGINGEAPYLHHGSTMTVDYSRWYNDPSNVYISMWVFPLSALRSDFDGNIAATSGGAVYIGNSVSNVFVMPGTVFTDNTVIAGSGGALFLASYINYLYFYSSMFSGNNASSGGGAVAFQDLISSVHFYSCSFTFNSAQYGGALYLDTGNGNDFTKTGLVKVIEFVNLTMRHNIAALDGGGIYANNLNAFSIAGSRMVDNIAGRSGGAITMNIVNTMSISTSTSFVHNSSGTDGGAICFNANNTITSLVGNTITFSRNTCKGRGGALAMNTGSVVTFNGTATFNSNYAQRQGGAIAVSASSLAFGPGAIKFVNNSALSGSAVYLTSSSTSSVSLLASYIEVLFLNNVCRGGKQGGTVFFVKDPQTTTQLFGPQMTYYNQRVVFVNNTAGVGREVATQTTSLRSTSNHTTIIVTDYNLFLRPSLAFNLVDVFNNINTTDFDTTVSVLFPYPTLSNHHPV